MRSLDLLIINLEVPFKIFNPLIASLLLLPTLTKSPSTTLYSSSFFLLFFQSFQNPTLHSCLSLPKKGPSPKRKINLVLSSLYRHPAPYHSHCARWPLHDMVGLLIFDFYTFPRCGIYCSLTLESSLDDL